MEEIFVEGIFSIIYTYNSFDKMFNPFYKNIAINEYESDLVGYAFYFITSKNNPLEGKITRSEAYMEEVNHKYSYTYNKKFPIEIEVSSTVTNYGETFSLLTNKIYYEYE
jgi:hypothetical protein